MCSQVCVCVCACVSHNDHFPEASHLQNLWHTFRERSLCPPLQTRTLSSLCLFLLPSLCVRPPGSSALSSRLPGHLSILIPSMGKRFGRQSFLSEGLQCNAQSAAIALHLSRGENARTGRVVPTPRTRLYFSAYIDKINAEVRATPQLRWEFTFKRRD